MNRTNKKIIFITIIAFIISMIITYLPMITSLPLWFLRTNIGTHMMAYAFGPIQASLMAIVLNIIQNSIGMGSGVILQVLVSLTLQAIILSLLYKLLSKTVIGLFAVCVINALLVNMITGFVSVAFSADKAASLSLAVTGYQNYLQYDFSSFLTANIISMIIGVSIVKLVDRNSNPRRND